MAFLKYFFTLAALGFLFVGFIYLITFVLLGIFQALMGYSARKTSDERQQQWIRRSEPVLLVINSYLYATCIAALTRATLAARSISQPWLYYGASFFFLFFMTLGRGDEKLAESTRRMRYFLLTFLAASYLFPDFIAPFWKPLWSWWFS